MNIFQKIKDHFSPKQDVYFEGFKKTDERFGQGLFKLLRKKPNLDEDFFQELNQVLIASDVGVDASKQILKRLEKDVNRLNIKTSSKAIEQMVEILFDVLIEYPFVLEERLNIILMVGVNGSGKTTSSAKLAALCKAQGKKVLLVAADTFRAAAVKQLQTWAERIEVPCFVGKENSDPAAVVVDACKKATQEGFDVLIIDTAGRLQTKVNLMQELEKIQIGRAHV